MLFKSPGCRPGAIIFVATTPWGNYEGASENLWQDTAGWLLQQGFPVGICVHDYGPLPEKLDFLRKAGAVFHYRSPPQGHEEKPLELTPLGGWFIRKNWISVPSRQDTLEWIKKQKPGLVLVNQCENFDGSWCLAGLAQRSIPFVSMTHSGGAELWPPDKMAGQLLEGLSRARVNYFCSENNRRWMETQVAADLPNVRIFRNPYQVSFHPECQWPESTTLNFAMVSRLDPRSKAHDLVLKIMAGEKWRHRDAVVNIYGQGPRGKGIRNLVRRWNIPKVRFLGHVNDIEAIWGGNHYLLQPSRYEGLPCTLVEAMLCGRGAVVTDVGGNAELVEDGISGFVARHPQVDLVAAAMERCWERREEAREIGKAARFRAELCIPEDPAAVLGQELIGLTGKDTPLPLSILESGGKAEFSSRGMQV